MEIFHEIAPLKAFLRQIRSEGKACGLVPTMGALHGGHISLLNRSKNENSVTVCSIYVNPTQFNNPADLRNYPRNHEKDYELLQKVGCDVVFSPSDAEMYPDKPVIKFEFGPLDDVMEGYYRPGHFSGVALVVAKLLNIVQPDRAYFGQKDWQQATIISRLVEELQIPSEIRTAPTIREPDGLAMSSRNMRLQPSQRPLATIFYDVLTYAKNAILKEGMPFSHVLQRAREMFDRDPQLRLEYLEMVDSKNLNAITNVSEAERPILCIAGYVGEVRLIDNMFLDLSSN
ncbi:MAG TPA: pantoate--beta-alanine ligase [Cyclobacteriaceae bacterium]|nr:pantoate--beta-alanine ligase [Cyclobacteriaceae bacterium]